MDKEQQNALNKYGHFHSTHEVYGVLIEEVQELFDIVREQGIENKGKFEDFVELARYEDKIKRMCKELDQIRAVAERAKNELMNDKIKWI